MTTNELTTLVASVSYVVLATATWLWLAWHDRSDGDELLYALFWPFAWLIGLAGAAKRASNELALYVRRYREKREGQIKSYSDAIEPPHPFPPPPPLRDEGPPS